MLVRLLVMSLLYIISPSTSPSVEQNVSVAITRVRMETVEDRKTLTFDIDLVIRGEEGGSLDTWELICTLAAADFTSPVDNSRFKITNPTVLINRLQFPAGATGFMEAEKVYHLTVYMLPGVHLVSQDGSVVDQSTAIMYRISDDIRLYSRDLKSFRSARLQGTSRDAIVID